jgi:16S rRNA (cytosine967-C5)-methyltransferase
MVRYLATVSRYHSYLNSAKQILQSYNGEEPFASFLKKYFSANKKFGSKDRKHVSNLCYSFFRLGKAVMNTSLEEKILTALFLCSDSSNEILAALKPEWNEKINLTTNKKLLIINYSLLLQSIFPWKEELSDGIDHEKFCRSFLIQPDVFLRIRPGKKQPVIKKSQATGLKFQIVDDSSLALFNATKLEDILDIDKEVVIQDLNSQRTGDFIKSQISNLKSQISVWDCCAASGGKSIMAYDIDPNIDLTVSDIRENILINLKKRFQQAGIKNYKSFTADLSSEKSQISNLKYQIIVCDAPCSGSGTWSRTPEQLYFFDEDKIEKYSSLQQKIVSNVIPQLQNGGSFVYITCSVFRKENEEVVEFIKKNFDLQLKQMEILKGYDKKADSMFVAVFEKL